MAAREAALKLLARQPDITAFFAHNDLLAIGALSALRKLGKDVPGDCSVVGCDDIEMAAYTVPPLTTVLVPFHEAGVSAMSVLLGTKYSGALSSSLAVRPCRWRKCDRVQRSRSRMARPGW